jgi:hypothetical protein
MRRIRPKDVLLMASLVFAAYLLISQLADIGFGTIWNELSEADLVGDPRGHPCADSFDRVGRLGSGAWTLPLALLPCVVLQSAIKFINLTVPSSAGRIGMNLRFLQRQGVPRGQALAASRRRRVRDDRAGSALLRRARS